jgi:hypothetical protein
MMAPLSEKACYPRIAGFALSDWWDVKDLNLRPKDYERGHGYR